MSLFATNSSRKESITVSAEKEFIDTYACVAVKEMEYRGIPASIKLAQGILESNFGKAELATKANNFFGIKGFNLPKEACFFKKDDDYKDGKLIPSCFQKFENPLESWQYHSQFLLKPRYEALFRGDKNYKEWAEGLKKAGYATDEKYDIKLTAIIEKYGLQHFDKLNSIDVCASIAIGATVYINGTKAVMSGYGASLETIARAVEKPVSRLSRYNEHLYRKEETLAEGSIVFLEPKKSSFDAKRFHIADGKESWRNLSQQYGIQIEKLLDYNKSDLQSAIQPRQRIRLQKYNWLEQWRNIFKAKSKKKTQLYIIKKGDTLYSIANQYNISLETLLEINNLETEQLFPGQQLIIPSGTE